MSVLVTGSYDQTVRVWTPNTEECRKVIGFPKPVNAIALSGDRSQLVVAGFDMCYLYDVVGSTREQLASLDGHTQNITSCHYHTSGSTTQFITTSEDFTANVWDLTTFRVAQTMKHTKAVNTSVPLPNSPIVITGDQGGCLHAWDMRNTRGPLSTYIAFPHDVGVRSLSVAQAQNILACCDARGIIQAYTLNSDGGNFFELQTSIQGHTNMVTHVNVSYDGQYIASSSADTTCKVWSVNLDSPIKLSRARIFSKNEFCVWGSAFTLDAAYIIIAADKTAKLWRIGGAGDADVPQLFRTYSGHSKAITCLALADAKV